MKIIQTFLILFLFCQNSWAESQSLDQLLKAVKHKQTAERAVNRQREARFLAEKKLQQQRLADISADLKQQEALSARLNKTLADNELLLGTLTADLKVRSGELGELFAVARQAAGDLQADLTHSLISAQYPNRTQALADMVDAKALPTIAQLENLWFSLQQEMTESSKIVRFSTPVERNGVRSETEVIRVGAFNAFTAAGYLSYSVATKMLVNLPRQPEAHYLDLLAAFFHEQGKELPLGVDPTQGVLLSMLIQAPDALERIRQGGIIGYIIIGLGLLGFLYALLRLVVLTLTGQKMRQQVNNSVATTDNPLGRVLLATENSQIEDTETLELLLDEAITHEVPALEKGLSMIKLFAAVAPLLGLLGTVTGMIATFQSISLFGTGDPKLMANGISQALVTTMLGLCAAIPLLFLHNLVASRSKALVQILDEQSAGIISRRAGK